MRSVQRRRTLYDGRKDSYPFPRNTVEATCSCLDFTRSPYQGRGFDAVFMLDQPPLRRNPPRAEIRPRIESVRSIRHAFPPDSTIVVAWTRPVPARARCPRSAPDSTPRRGRIRKGCALLSPHRVSPAPGAPLRSTGKAQSGLCVVSGSYRGFLERASYRPFGHTGLVQNSPSLTVQHYKTHTRIIRGQRSLRDTLTPAPAKPGGSILRTKLPNGGHAAPSTRADESGPQLQSIARC